MVSKLRVDQIEDLSGTKTIDVTDIPQFEGATGLVFYTDTLAERDALTELSTGQQVSVGGTLYRWDGSEFKKENESKITSFGEFGSDSDSLVAQRSIWDIQKSGSGERVDFLNKPLVFKGGVVHGRGDSGINNFTVTADGDFTDSDNNDAILRVNTGLRQNYRDVTMHCGGVSNGLWNETNGFFNHYNHIEIDDYRDFGIQFDGSVDQHLISSLITGQPEVSERSGTGVRINASDFKLVNTTIRYAETPLEVNAGTLHATGNHIYNGSANSADPATDSTGISLTGGSGMTFSHTYLDKGSVKCIDTFSASFFDTKMLFNTEPEHQSVFNFYTSEDGRDWPDEFSFDGARSTLPLDNGDMKFVRLSGREWTEQAETIKDEINLRNFGYPRIVPQETSHFVAPDRTEISKGKRTSKFHVFGNNTFYENNYSGVNEVYENSYAGFESGGIVLASKGSGQFTSGFLRAEGSRTGQALVSELQFRNRKGAAEWSETDGFEIDLRMRGHVNDSFDSLQVVGKTPGQTEYQVWTEFNKNGFRPGSDSVMTCGSPGHKWSEVYATNGSISTSDEREKSFADIEEVEYQVAREAKKLLKKFKWNSSIEKKGEDGARWHFGVGAQSLQDVFEYHGLNAHEYGLFCYDEWDEEYEEVEVSIEVLDDEGNVIEEAVTERRKIKEAGNQYGVRYEELLAFIISAL